MKKLILVLNILLFTQGSVSSIFAQKKDDLNLSARIQPADTANFIRDKKFYNWCNSIIRDDSGTYHLFYSRWPRKFTFFGWLTHSEIAHATSRSMMGPYTKGKTILTGRKGYWDSVMAHNVQVNKFGKNYFMYYISTNTGSQKLSADMLKETALTGYSHKYWKLLRNNQRAGVAVASSLNGPWKRMDKPFIQPGGPITTVTVNPSVCQGKDGKYCLIIKGDDANATKKRRLIQAVGVSDSPLGNFKLESTPAFAEIPTEDVCVWYDQKRERFYALFHAHGGNFIGMITSPDGKTWEKAANYKVCKKEIPLKDGTIMKVDRMERPYVYLENGEIKMISFGAKKGNDSFIVLFECK